MGFTKEVLDFARWITAQRYPNDAGSINAGCLKEAIALFQRWRRPTLYITKSVHRRKMARV